MTIPEFEPDELRAELDRLFANAGDRTRPLVALFGRASCDSVETKTFGTVLVRSVRSEYELRRVLPDLHAETERMAVLVGWPQTEVPVDLSWRFAKDGKIFRIGKADRLRRIFGDTGSLVTVDASLGKSKLANVLLADGITLRTNAGRVTLELAYELWLRHAWGVGTDSSLGLDTLLAWAATHGRVDDFAKRMAEPSAEGVQDELRSFLEARVSEVAGLVWDLWAQGKGRTLLEFAVLFESLVDADGAGPMAAIRTASKFALGLAGPAFENAWRPLGRVVEPALRELRRTVDESFVRQLLLDAQHHLDGSEQEQLAASRRLPIAWELRLGRLGQTLASGADHPTPATVEQARDDLRALERHEHFQKEDQRRRIELAEMATRLLAWLVARTDQRLPKGHQPHADAEALAGWYAQEGGYVDWARHRCRGMGDPAHGKGIARMLARVDAIRVEQDRRFARGLAAWLEAGRPSGSMLPIDRAVEAFAARFLDRDPEHRVLVLLIDGMAWAQAVAMLHSLDAGAVPWCPLAWNVEAFPGQTAMFTPVLASLPSVTNVSRSAFFAGKPMEPGKEPSASGNAKHWQANKSIAKFFSGVAVPKLLLRGDGFTSDGAAAPEALTLVADTSQRIVALVINAIDETLKADTQAHGAWTADQIGPLRELLQAARAAGRAVFIAADHGHVSGQRLQWTGFTGGSGSSRWRAWKEGDPVHEYEIAVAHAHTWGPKGDGVKGVICLADDEHSYATQVHYGEHGGATLSEVVAPTFMIGCEHLAGPQAGEADRALELRHVRAPDWWHLEVRPAGRKSGTSIPAVKPTAKTKLSIEREKAGQIAIEPATASVAAPSKTDAIDELSNAMRELLAKLVANPLFAARTEKPKRRQEVVRALEFLLERNPAPEALFSAHMGAPVFRVAGLVASLSEVLNVDGYPLLERDALAKQVTLNVEALKMGFGL